MGVIVLKMQLFCLPMRMYHPLSQMMVTDVKPVEHNIFYSCALVIHLR